MVDKWTETLAQFKSVTGRTLEEAMREILESGFYNHDATHDNLARASALVEDDMWRVVKREENNKDLVNKEKFIEEEIFKYLNFIRNNEVLLEELRAFIHKIEADKQKREQALADHIAQERYKEFLGKWVADAQQLLTDEFMPSLEASMLNAKLAEQRELVNNAIKALNESISRHEEIIKVYNEMFGDVQEAKELVHNQSEFIDQQLDDIERQRDIIRNRDMSDELKKEYMDVLDNSEQMLKEFKESLNKTNGPLNNMEININEGIAKEQKALIEDREQLKIASEFSDEIDNIMKQDPKTWQAYIKQYGGLPDDMQAALANADAKFESILKVLNNPSTTSPMEANKLERLYELEESFYNKIQEMKNTCAEANKFRQEQIKIIEQSENTNPEKDLETLKNLQEKEKAAIQKYNKIQKEMDDIEKQFLQVSKTPDPNTLKTTTENTNQQKYDNNGLFFGYSNQQQNKNKDISLKEMTAKKHKP